MTSTTHQPVLPAGEPPSWWERQSDLIMRRPINEFTFTHMNWLIPTERVARGHATRSLPAAPLPLDLTYRYDDTDHTIADLHRRTFTTAFVVLHHGTIVHESYPGAFAGPRTRMQLFSLSKSVTSVLIGIALAEGAIGSVKDQVTDYRRDFRGTAYDGTTLADLLDMTSGVGDLETWDGSDSFIRQFERAVLSGGDVAAIIRRAPRTADIGERFNYSTFDAQVLGWVLEAATGRSLAAYASDRLWRRIGAERDAYYGLTRSHPRTAIGAGAFNATARDLARVGLLMANDGIVAGEQVVPADWVRRSRGADLPHLAVGALGPSGYDHYGYANQWWTLGESCFQAFTGLGVHGQYLFVDPVADVVIVKCSAWPTEDDPARDHETITALRRIADHFA
ncbi:6-aminohexanoate-dimer hydrolase [Actinoplanes sp. NBRC 14428]|uniref:CubicO group peptidase (Beta-lactamase class C family) n=1 Tax=Pseudosporangium ferrugineum TaxID=439699 RepID=A0A2T0RX94_9ACTN|nr:serine hydrolase [Pseudosporangium ferrugineum]PRY25752.1 CubicO group peptidase (beta-lactamase class C family) [Pseudosporangium ferrugineum]BCJ56201.1 6-aminohexanoate-dimer hydrolase [Actinoplanes sp. NBRC 14428]